MKHGDGDLVRHRGGFAVLSVRGAVVVDLPFQGFPLGPFFLLDAFPFGTQDRAPRAEAADECENGGEEKNEEGDEEKDGEESDEPALAGILGDEAREDETEHPAVDTGFEEETRERIPGPVITGEEIGERSKG